MSNYYENFDFSAVERAVLAEDIVLPEVTSAALTLSFFDNNPRRQYKLAEQEYTNMKGKFYLPILTPLVDKTDTSNRTGKSPSIKGSGRESLSTSNYSTSNYLTLTIPKYIVLQFRSKIPKGTEFLIAIQGGEIKLDRIRIVGLYTI